MNDPVRSDDEFLVFGEPAIEQPEIDEVVDSLESAWLGTGPKAEQFETNFAEYVGAEHAIATNSCTAALILSLMSLDLEEGDEVITTPLTFCATVNAIIHAGGTPVLADVDPETMNIDPDAVEAAITDRTRAILPVHFAGRPCEMDQLQSLAETHDLTIIEDAAHAIETTYRGQHAGTFGDFGCFSFYATKNVTTGEGGMLVTDDAEAAERLRHLSLHGVSRDAWSRFDSATYDHYRVVEPGFKFNMMDLQAAIGLHQLERVETNWERRREVWGRYQEAFADDPVERPAPAPFDASGERHGLHLYTLLIEEDEAGLARDHVLDAMQRHNIGVGVQYLAIPEHPYYQERFGWRPEETPHATDIGRRTVSIPLAPHLSERDVEDVIEAVHRITSG